MKIELTDEEVELARKAIEDLLIDFRDSRLSVIRNNGLVCKEMDGTPSSIIRIGFDDALRIAIKIINDHRAQK